VWNKSLAAACSGSQWETIMKTFLIASGIVGVLGLTALLADIKIDYDHAADFNAFRTYSWINVDAGNSCMTGWVALGSGEDSVVTAWPRHRSRRRQSAR
jgi:hypothetical protein